MIYELPGEGNPQFLPGDGSAPAPESEMRETNPIRRNELRQTNPISAAGKEEASAWPERSYGESYIRSASAKQSQLRRSLKSEV